MTQQKPAPRALQQQPERAIDPQQQRGGATDFQSGNSSQVQGEGSYTATGDYQNSIRNYLDHADVQADAQAAKPVSEAEARELEAAERAARAHSKGER
ncbi:hypothetical protein [Ramlibacter sp.]|uniref:hypothetical protein n=1 Tax=Ramlibacter sp. TaxID=1917967 RepID=UPI00260468F7|nr:hypothetical protein [Ramlibacter sp.]MDB5957601.1 hypothetical protein [Ramlibacter sp.]